MDEELNEIPGGPPIAVPSPEDPAARRAPRPLIETVLPIVVVSVIVLLLPLFIPSFVSSLVTKMMIFGLFGVSLNLIWGYANIPSFGHAAFFGVGAYTAAVLVTKAGIANFWLGLLLAIIVTAAVAAILGVPAFRVFGVGAGAANPIYFLLATIAFGELLSRLAITIRPVTGGIDGPIGHPRMRDLGFGINVTREPVLLPGLRHLRHLPLPHVPHRQLALRLWRFAASTTTSGACRRWDTTPGSTSTRRGSSPPCSAAWPACCSPTSGAP